MYTVIDSCYLYNYGNMNLEQRFYGMSSICFHGISTVCLIISVFSFGTSLLCLEYQIDLVPSLISCIFMAVVSFVIYRYAEKIKEDFLGGIFEIRGALNIICTLRLSVIVATIVLFLICSSVFVILPIANAMVCDYSKEQTIGVSRSEINLTAADQRKYANGVTLGSEERKSIKLLVSRAKKNESNKNYIATLFYYKSAIREVMEAGSAEQFVSLISDYLRFQLKLVPVSRIDKDTIRLTHAASQKCSSKAKLAKEFYLLYKLSSALDLDDISSDFLNIARRMQLITLNKNIVSFNLSVVFILGFLSIFSLLDCAVVKTCLSRKRVNLLDTLESSNDESEKLQLLSKLVDVNLAIGDKEKAEKYSKMLMSSVEKF